LPDNRIDKLIEAVDRLDKCEDTAQLIPLVMR
jgi:hypothetical protein